MVQSASSVCDVKLRLLCPLDREVVENLCKQWFPINYPNTWYDEITSTNKFYTLVATLNEEIVGLIVAEIKPYSRCKQEDLGLLCPSLEKTSRIAYILTIGVVQRWRRHGIATILLDKLIENLTIDPMLEDCKAIYLHVLTTNTVAMRFYESSHFKRHKFLPLYYMINTAACDGYSYVLYINGGRPPPTILYPFRISHSPHGSPIYRVDLYSLIASHYAFFPTQVESLDFVALCIRIRRLNRRKESFRTYFRLFIEKFHIYQSTIIKDHFTPVEMEINSHDHFHSSTLGASHVRF